MDGQEFYYRQGESLYNDNVHTPMKDLPPTLGFGSSSSPFLESPQTVEKHVQFLQWSPSQENSKGGPHPVPSSSHLLPSQFPPTGFNGLESSPPDVGRYATSSGVSYDQSASPKPAQIKRMGRRGRPRKYDLRDETNTQSSLPSGTTQSQAQGPAAEHASSRRASNALNQSSVNLSGMHHPMERVMEPKEHRMDHSMDQSIMNQSMMNQSAMSESVNRAQPAMGQLSMGQSTMNQSAMNHSVMNQAAMGQNAVSQAAMVHPAMGHPMNHAIMGSANMAFSSAPSQHTKRKSASHINSHEASQSSSRKRSRPSTKPTAKPGNSDSMLLYASRQTSNGVPLFSSKVFELACKNQGSIESAQATALRGVLAEREEKQRQFSTKGLRFNFSINIGGKASIDMTTPLTPRTPTRHGDIPKAASNDAASTFASMSDDEDSESEAEPIHTELNSVRTPPRFTSLGSSDAAAAFAKTLARTNDQGKGFMFLFPPVSTPDKHGQLTSFVPCTPRTPRVSMPFDENAFNMQMQTPPGAIYSYENPGVMYGTGLTPLMGSARGGN